MGFKIGLYESKTSRVTPSISAPQPLRPPPGAFGADIAEALQNLGEVGQKVVEHSTRMAYEKQDMEDLRRETAYRQDWQDRLYNNEIENARVNFQNVQRPKGLLMRELGQADGVVKEADAVNEQMKKEYLKGLSQYQYEKLAPALDKYYISIKDNLASHEATQYRANLKNATESNITQKILDASAIRDSKSLGLAIDDAVNSALPYNSRFDPTTKKVMDDEIAGKIIKSAVLSAQENAGLLPAQKLLNDVKDRIPQSQFDDLSKEIQINAEQATKRVRFEQVVAQNKVESGVVDKYFQGQLTRDEVKQLHLNRQISDGFAKAMMNNLDSVKKINAKTDSATFNKIAGDILDPAKKAEDIRNELLNKNAIGELSDEDFNILNTFYQIATKETVDKAMPKKTWLQRLFNNGKEKGLRQEIMTQMFKQYIQKTSQGDDPAKAVSEIISTHLDNHLVEEAKKPNRQYAVNPETKQRAYSEDGGLTWYDEKTNQLIK